MSTAKARDIVNRRDERRRRHRAYVGHRAQPPDARVRPGDGLNALVGVRELVVHVPPDGQEGCDLREQASGQGEFANPAAEGFGGAAADAPAVLAEQRADDGDVARAGAHERVAHGEAGPHVALLIGQAMRAPVGAQETRLGQGARVPSVRLHFAGALRVHRREVRVGDDHLVAQRLEAPRHPLAFGRGLDEDPRPPSVAQDLGGPVRLRPDPALEQFPRLGQDADLAVLLVDVDANMIHGWPPTLAAMTACLCVGRLYATTLSEGVSRFIPIYALDYFLYKKDPESQGAAATRNLDLRRRRR